LLIQLAGLGDMVMVKPTIENLKQLYPQAKICLLTNARSVEIIRGSPFIDEIFVLEGLIKIFATVKRLRDYIRKNKIVGKDIFLLRNLSRRGIGFFGESGFYPDFIMWIKEGHKQTLIFIDPKGIRNLGNFNDEKIRLHKEIKEIEEKFKNQNLRLESVIISVSKYDEMKKTFDRGNIQKQEFEDNHVFFMEDSDLIEKILKI